MKKIQRQFSFHGKANMIFIFGFYIQEATMIINISSNILYICGVSVHSFIIFHYFLTKMVTYEILD